MHKYEKGNQWTGSPFSIGNYSGKSNLQRSQQFLRPMNKFLDTLLRAILSRRFYVTRWTDRYLAWLEQELGRKTRFAESELNGERLWSNVRQTVEDLLYSEFRRGALVGSKPEQGYFARCDRSTMTQNDLDNGRLICLVGVAPLRPAEFVIFRIGQWTKKPDP